LEIPGIFYNVLVGLPKITGATENFKTSRDDFLVFAGQKKTPKNLVQHSTCGKIHVSIVYLRDGIQKSFMR